MAKKNIKTHPGKVLEMAKAMKPVLAEAKRNTDTLFSNIKSSTTANKGKSYWNGKKAFTWYGVAVRNCANDYYKIANVAAMYSKMCASAYKFETDDNKLKGKEISRAVALHDMSQAFDSLKDSCKAKRNQVITWGKS